MKIVILDGYTLNPGDLDWDAFKSLGDLTVFDRTEHDTKKIIEAIGDAEIVLTNKTPISEAILQKAPKLKYIGLLATGYNNVDIDTAQELDIIVTNIPTYGTTAVAQFTMALLLEMCHHVGEHNSAVQRGGWRNRKDFSFWNYPLIELEGKTMGIIGFGSIGRATAKLAEAFGMKIITTPSSNKPETETAIKVVDMDTLLKQSDVVSLHLPLTDDTEGLINKTTIAKMKNSAMLINTARGGLIVEKDLKDALNSGQLAYAAVDVVSTEPITEDNPLLKAKNCIITPHIAWAPKASRTRLMTTAIENLKAFLNDQPVNVVKP
ncbi:D-2-hydroxyacid dehydrogenase [Winogradskyella schleiferi]|uniref:D-2-hydroxyacid dehydrogenase n=1 Tax=Winogradskyella schleiferi TaxID=2686078 RepID=UPI0015C04EEC|nr:D-2-hydroxyacid dehydrogenase [Winogradskyella schleiferi]